MLKNHHAYCVALFAAASLFLLYAGSSSFTVGQDIAPKAIDPNETLLEAIGTIGGVQLYQTYLNIGFIADGHGQGIYSEEEARELLATVIVPLDRIAKQFDSVKRVAADQDDKKALERLAKISAILKDEGARLTAFWTTGTDEDANRFEKTRQQAWKEISSFLQLEATPQNNEPELAPAPKKIR